MRNNDKEEASNSEPRTWSVLVYLSFSFYFLHLGFTIFNFFDALSCQNTIGIKGQILSDFTYMGYLEWLNPYRQKVDQ